MARKKIWNQTPLKDAFEDFRRGEASSADLEVLHAPVTPYHIEDLVLGARSLLRQKTPRNKPPISEYEFSDGAIQAVRQSSAYIRDRSQEKHLLKWGSIVHFGDGGYRFARLYHTQLSPAESQIRLDADIASETGVLPLDDTDNPIEAPGLDLQMRIDETAHDFERCINVLREGSPEAAEGSRTNMYYDGSSKRYPAQLAVVDYMTLGHLIEFDKR